MTTNNQNVDNSTSVLVKESQLAQLAEVNSIGETIGNVIFQNISY